MPVPIVMMTPTGAPISVSCDGIPRPVVSITVVGPIAIVRIARPVVAAVIIPMMAIDAAQDESGGDAPTEPPAPATCFGTIHRSKRDHERKCGSGSDRCRRASYHGSLVAIEPVSFPVDDRKIALIG